MESYETRDGDFVIIHYNVAPFRGIHSVRTLFDALLYRTVDAEILMAEASVSIAIREDDDNNPDSSIFYHRLVSTGPVGVLIDTCGVVFPEFHEASALCPEYGVITGDSVDEGYLYPYRPAERVRKDINFALMLSPIWKKNYKERRGIYRIGGHPHSLVHDEAVSIQTGRVQRYVA